ncbi:MAG TPA: hypothetical protein VFZ68_07220 [Acidimicrobiales bacterium]
MRPVVAPAGSDSPGTGHHRRAPFLTAGSTLVVLALLLASALLAGCGDDGGDGDDATGRSRAPAAASPGSPSVDVVAGGLCEALTSADAGDLATARETFDHGPLHDLADAAIGVDRAVAARLLEAKEAVESDLADDGAAAHRVAEDLRSLVVATGDALAVTGVPSPSPCEGDGP